MRTGSLTLIILLCGLSAPLKAIETLPYQVLATQGAIEIRRYGPHLLATVQVAADFDDAGSQGFRPLFNYISGDNAGAEKIAMTAPVLQQADAPSEDGQWSVSFVLPGVLDQQSAPAPQNDAVQINQQSGFVVAALAYRGSWSRKNYAQHEELLLAGIKQMALSPCGAPLWARFDPPFMPWFLRKNEILVPLCSKPEL